MPGHVLSDTGITLSLQKLATETEQLVSKEGLDEQQSTRERLDELLDLVHSLKIAFANTRY